MDWINAKKIIIISLIFVNVFLFVLHKKVDIEYVLTNEQNQNIKNVLADNNIGVYATLPTDYKPMAELELNNTPLQLDQKNFPNIIDQSTEIIPLIEEGRTTYLIDSVRILVDENNFIVDTTNNKEICTIEGDEITYLSNIIKDMGVDFENYELDKEINANSSIKYEFREVYDGIKLYNNYIQFTVVDNYLYKIQGQQIQTIGYSSDTQEIISPDIALFTFMSIVKDNEIYETDEVFVNSIDIVYYKNYENSFIDDLQSVCVPAYRIYTEQGELPFIINAYTNKLMNY